VTVVDRTNHHLFQPLLYQVAAGILPPGLIAPALRSIIKKQANAHALLAEVTNIDLAKREVTCEAPDGRALTLPYDTLVVAGGATHSYFGRNEFAEFAPGMKTIEDARYLRDRILSAFELAELSTDPAERAELLTFVVIGAGPTGVETVGQIAELAHTVLPRDYRSINTREARIILLEGAGSVLPPFDKKLQDYTHRVLEKMGVEIHLNSLAVGMDDDSVTVKSPDGVETIRCRTRIWAAGVAASPLAAMLAEQAGVETDRAGRIPVNPDCTVAGHPEVFAVGDMVSLNKLPGVAQPALQEGHYVGKVIKARLEGKPAPPPFKYFDKGSMATIGYRPRWRTRSASRSPACSPTSCGRSSTWPTSSAGATGSARSTRGPGPWCSPRTAATGSSPSSRRTRRSSTTRRRRGHSRDRAVDAARRRLGAVGHSRRPATGRPSRCPTGGREAG
jgi:NADH dehydrogenase